MMENKVESPDYQMMDISEAGTVTTDNISTSSVSPEENEIGPSENINEIVEFVTKNINSVKITSTKSPSHDKENQNNLTLDTNHQQQHQTQKLTPVHHHPLMFDDPDDDNDNDCNNSNVSNFPDVVLAHHQPLRLGQPVMKSRTTTADLVNSVNNNRKPLYREPSPVSNFKSPKKCKSKEMALVIS